MMISLPWRLVFAALTIAIAAALEVGSTAAQAVYEPPPPELLEAGESLVLAPPINADVVIEEEAVTLTGPVSEFEVALPEGSSGASLDAVLAEDGVSAELLLHYDNPADAALEASAPPGVDVEIIQNDDGEQSVMLTDASGELVGGIAFESAVTESGLPVEVLLSHNGDRIAQTFTSDHDVVSEPVTVRAVVSTVWYKRGWVTKKAGTKYIVNVDPTALGRQQIAWNTHATHVKHAKKVLGPANTRTYWNWNIEQQFVCHVVGAWWPSGVYNMESWQPALPWQAIANPWDRCNRSKK